MPVLPVMRRLEGGTVELDVDRWHATPAAVELALLSRVKGPVLDVGCGPARHVRALAERQVPVLGIDVSPVAVAAARRRGEAVLRRSVFDHLPGTGRWQTVLLLDGNVGIGGDPARLLERSRSLLAPDGEIVVEVDEPGSGLERLTVRLERGDDRGPWFRWARIGADVLGEVAGEAGLAVAGLSGVDRRWFGWLTPADATISSAGSGGSAGDPLTGSLLVP